MKTLEQTLVKDLIVGEKYFLDFQMNSVGSFIEIVGDEARFYPIVQGMYMLDDEGLIGLPIKAIDSIGGLINYDDNFVTANNLEVGQQYFLGDETVSGISVGEGEDNGTPTVKFIPIDQGNYNLDEDGNINLPINYPNYKDLYLTFYKK